jgi:hypothetical protein
MTTLIGKRSSRNQMAIESWSAIRVPKTQAKRRDGAIDFASTEPVYKPVPQSSVFETRKHEHGSDGN